LILPLFFFSLLRARFLSVIINLDGYLGAKISRKFYEFERDIVN
jgi:hypothetical protein